MINFEYFNTIEEYEAIFKQIPALLLIGREPFIVKLLLTIIPQFIIMLKKKRISLNGMEIPRLVIYEHFIYTWIKNEIHRLSD